MKTEELIYNAMCKAFKLGQRNRELASSEDFTWEKSDKLLDEFFEIAENAKNWLAPMKKNKNRRLLCLVGNFVFRKQETLFKTKSLTSTLA